MGTQRDDGEQTGGAVRDDCASQGDTTSVNDVTVEVATVDYTLKGLCRRYNAHSRAKRLARIRTQLPRKSWAPLWNLQNLTILITVVVFVVMIIIWSLLWVFIFRRESNSGVYFAGMFRVANVEFIPEYRQADSHEFISMTNKIQHVVSSVYRMSSVSKLYKLSAISDLSDNDEGGVLVHFWIVFVVPSLTAPTVCEECVGAILRDSVLTSLKNRSSVGYLLGLPVDMDSILVNAALRSDYTAITAGSQCVDKLYASVPGSRVPLNVYSSWGGLSCFVKLTSAPGSLIRLTISSLLIEPSDCVSDAFTVYDALLPMRGRTLYRMCDPVSQSLSLVSTSNFMLLSFRMTPGNKNFQGHFQAIADEQCLISVKTQADPGFIDQISSPFYPSLIPPQGSCTWRFQTPSTSLGVALMFYNYVLKLKDVTACEHGWWKVNEIIYCGSYTDYTTVFRIPHYDSEVEFRSSSRNSGQPFQAEYSSFNISQPCAEGYFLCVTGLCVEKIRRCDGVDDCQDESDEVFCSTPSLNCGSSSPLHALYVCNGEVDCINGRDETNCTLEMSCSDISYRCNSGSCIRKRNARCDGVLDCADQSDERDCACGRPRPARADSGPRVVGGVNAVEGEWPWQVSLHFSGYLYCGATVVSSDWLISAAHCFSKDRLSDPGQWSAHLGMLSQGSARHVSEIRRIVVHEYYSGQTFDYDVALLRLRSPWPSSLGPFVQPVCLPAPSQTVTRAHQCWVTGWGYLSEDDKTLPTVLQKAEVFVLDQSECKRRYGPITPRMLCAGVPSGEQDACKGDSGGALSCRAPGPEGRWFLTGIVSWGAGCGRPNLPGVYTRVNKFTSWIQNHIVP
ncbi:transmembrane protease serine 7 isoform X2 [Esox lucius]|uniref:Transmembrane serine protease 7 n=1 Tax=Esox lucius TaxID=8010 RepID=A0A3P8YD83_ESOLU|nr:transmembrane protease serine 7 isoform X2 [Esox lucius]